MMDRLELQTLLPFRANGSLEGAELAAVDAALADDAELRGELAALQALRDTMQAEEVNSPGEFGLARLMRDVEAEAPIEATPAANDAANDNVVPISRLRIWQVAAAVALAVGLGVNLVPQMNSAPEFASEMPEEVQFEEGGFSLASGGSTFDYQVIFAPTATEAEMRALLLDAGLEITDGPSALGLYGLSLIESGTDDDARSILAASQIIEELQ